jgi:predicted O-methyltransferase YrrM
MAAADDRVNSEPIDFLFIDGDHTFDGLKRDWEAWSTLIKRGGVVGLHDSRSTAEYPIHDAGSVKYTKEVIRLDTRFETIEEVDTLTILTRV